MPEKYKRIIKIIVIVCVLVLLFDIGYLIYITYFKKTEKTYFDSINMVEITNEGYIAVGSNNNNEKSYEKAKITQYDKNKNKVWEKLYNKGYNGSFFAVSMFTEGKNTAETESRAKVDMIRVIKHFMVFGKDNVDPSFLFFRNDW